MKGPNQRPNKGLLNELAQGPQVPAKKQSFSWSKPIVAPPAPQPANTLRRANDYASAKNKADTNVAAEMLAQKIKRQGK